jgi:hypothetical protein
LRAALGRQSGRSDVEAGRVEATRILDSERVTRWRRQTGGWLLSLRRGRRQGPLKADPEAAATARQCSRRAAAPANALARAGSSAQPAAAGPAGQARPGPRRQHQPRPDPNVQLLHQHRHGNARNPPRLPNNKLRHQQQPIYPSPACAWPSRLGSTNEIHTRRQAVIDRHVSTCADPACGQCVSPVNPLYRYNQATSRQNLLPAAGSPSYTCYKSAHRVVGTSSSGCSGLAGSLSPRYVID